MSVTTLLRSSITFLLLFFLVGCGAGSSPPTKQAELLVSAAASLSDAMTEMKHAFELENPAIIVTYTFGSSGKLATQIEQGAPSDLFLSASQKDMDRLQQKNAILTQSRINFASNELALITQKESPSHITSFDALVSVPFTHLAIGEPESVPVGRYAKETLTHLEFWTEVKEKLVFASDVRQVLSYVESGNAEIGIVYTSDVKTSDKVKVLGVAKPEWHKPIQYPGAVLSSSTHQKEAQLFLDYIRSEKGQSILNAYGFQ